ncbi:MAG: hypothetical protein JRJ14_05220 [Deltaproteobacteria bacterium]|nr:hypothetical protein [Deltaproteobacteria bacterium]
MAWNTLLPLSGTGGDAHNAFHNTTPTEDGHHVRWTIMSNRGIIIGGTMIWLIATGNVEMETDSEEFFRKTVKELNKKGKVEGKDYHVTVITPGQKMREAMPKP